MFYEKNIELLEKKSPSLANIIKSTHIDDNKYQTINTKNNNISLKVREGNKELYLHSKYNPVEEAKSYINHQIDPNVSVYVLYGFGLGYHIEQLLSHDSIIEIIVIEPNADVLRIALQTRDLSKILCDDRVIIICETDKINLARAVHEILMLQDIKFIIHSPSLQVMPENLLELKHLFEEYKIKQNGLNYLELLQKNFKENIRKCDQNVDLFFNKWTNTPLIIVSAGPSLNNNKHLLKKAKGKAIILAVGTAVKPLLQENISPDLVIMTDPTEMVFKHIQGVEINVPMIILSTCYSKVIEEYKGSKYIALQAGFDLAEQYAEKYHCKLVKTGGSVATTALDIAIQCGCNPIVFVGQDLAYTDGKTHAEGTSYCRDIGVTANVRKVQDIRGQVCATSISLYSYLKWIENRIKNEKDTTFINATAQGADIQGTVVMGLEDVVEKVLNQEVYFSVSS